MFEVVRVATLAYKYRYWSALFCSVIFWLRYGALIFFGDVVEITYDAFLPIIFGSPLFSTIVISFVLIVLTNVIFFIFYLLFIHIIKSNLLLKIWRISHLVLQGILLFTFIISYFIFSIFSAFGFALHFVAWISTALMILLIALGSVKQNVNNDYGNLIKQRIRGIILNIVVLIISSGILAFSIIIVIDSLWNLIFVVCSYYITRMAILNLIFNSSSPQKYLNSYKKRDLMKRDWFKEFVNNTLSKLRSLGHSIKHVFLPLLLGFGFVLNFILIALFQDDPDWLAKGTILKIIFATVFIIMGVITFFEITYFLPEKSEIKRTFPNYQKTRSKYIIITLAVLVGVGITLAGCCILLIISTTQPWKVTYAFPGKHTNRFFRFLIYSFFSILGIVAGFLILSGSFIGGRMTRDTLSGILSGFWTAIFCSICFYILPQTTGLQEKKLFIPAVALTFLVYSTALGFLGGFTSSPRIKFTKAVKMKDKPQLT